jgi:hypothetical protein
MFSVYGGKCLSCKAIHNWIENFSQGRSKVADDRPGAKVAETTVWRLLFCGFRRTGKAMGQVYQYLWRILVCREFFFFSLEYHVFHVLYPFVTYLLTLPRIFLCEACFCWLHNLIILPLWKWRRRDPKKCRVVSELLRVTTHSLLLKLPFRNVTCLICDLTAEMLVDSVKKYHGLNKYARSCC